MINFNVEPDPKDEVNWIEEEETVSGKSSNIKKIGYNSKTHRLYVVFKNGNAKYEYAHVPEEVYLAIKDRKIRAKDGHRSYGATFIHIVKNNPDKYPFRRID